MKGSVETVGLGSRGMLSPSPTKYTEQMLSLQRNAPAAKAARALFNQWPASGPVVDRSTRRDLLDGGDAVLGRLLGGINLGVAERFAVSCLEAPEEAAAA